MKEEHFEMGKEFDREFKALVRKYFPEYPTTDDDMDFLYHIQDSTSCFSPYIWSDET